MTLPKSSEAKKVNLDFNKNLSVLLLKILRVEMLNLSIKLKRFARSRCSNLIENLNPDTRNKLIEIESFNIDPEIFIELNESIQSEVLQLLSVDSY